MSTEELTSTDTRNVKISDVDSVPSKKKKLKKDINTNDCDEDRVIEEKTLIIKGEGNGADCEAIPEPYFSEEICEDVFFVYGEGSGYDCCTGNPALPSESVQNKSETDKETHSEENNLPSECSVDETVSTKSKSLCENEQSQQLQVINGAESSKNTPCSVSLSEDKSAVDDSQIDIKNTHSAPLPVTKRFLQNIPKINSVISDIDNSKSKLWTVDSLCSKNSESPENVSVRIEESVESTVLNSVHNSKENFNATDTTSVNESEFSVINKISEPIKEEKVNKVVDAQIEKEKENTLDSAKSMEVKKPMFFFGHPGCLKLSPISTKLNSTTVESKVENPNSKNMSTIKAESTTTVQNVEKEIMIKEQTEDKSSTNDLVEKMSVIKQIDKLLSKTSDDISCTSNISEQKQCDKISIKQTTDTANIELTTEDKLSNEVKPTEECKFSKEYKYNTECEKESLVFESKADCSFLVEPLIEHQGSQELHNIKSVSASTDTCDSAESFQKQSNAVILNVRQKEESNNKLDNSNLVTDIDDKNESKNEIIENNSKVSKNQDKELISNEKSVSEQVAKDSQEKEKTTTSTNINLDVKFCSNETQRIVEKSDIKQGTADLNIISNETQIEDEQSKVEKDTVDLDTICKEVDEKINDDKTLIQSVNMELTNDQCKLNSDKNVIIKNQNDTVISEGIVSDIPIIPAIDVAASFETHIDKIATIDDELTKTVDSELKKSTDVEDDELSTNVFSNSQDSQKCDSLDLEESEVHLQKNKIASDKNNQNGDKANDSELPQQTNINNEKFENLKTNISPNTEAAVIDLSNERITQETDVPDRKPNDEQCSFDSDKPLDNPKPNDTFDKAEDNIEKTSNRESKNDKNVEKIILQVDESNSITSIESKETVCIMNVNDSKVDISEESEDNTNKKIIKDITNEEKPEKSDVISINNVETILEKTDTESKNNEIVISKGKIPKTKKVGKHKAGESSIEKSESDLSESNEKCVIKKPKLSVANKSEENIGELSNEKANSSPDNNSKKGKNKIKNETFCQKSKADSEVIPSQHKSKKSKHQEIDFESKKSDMSTVALNTDEQANLIAEMSQRVCNVVVTKPATLHNCEKSNESDHSDEPITKSKKSAESETQKKKSEVAEIRSTRSTRSQAAKVPTEEKAGDNEQSSLKNRKRTREGTESQSEEEYIDSQNVKKFKSKPKISQSAVRFVAY